MDLGLSNRVVIITGGGGAIGGTTAKLLASQGAKVALFDLNEEAVNETKKMIESEIEGAQLFAGVADVTSSQEVEDVFAVAEKALGPCNILVNNAGFSRDKYLTRMDEEDWDLVHNVVLKGSFHCCRAVLPGMMERKWGRIINISSMAYLGNRGQTNYSSAKAGLIGMTNSLAREAGGFNITCNAVAPGLIATPRLRARPDFDKLQTKSLSLTPLPRLGVAEDVAKAVTFFTSSLADFITAQCLHVSGGR